MTGPRISYDEQPCACGNNRLQRLDEFIAHNVTVHFEAMGDAQFWIGVTDPATGRGWVINCGAVNPKTRGYAHIEED